MNSRKPPNIADIVTAMNRIAPAGLAEEWDSVGLQIGSADWQAGRIWTALDPTADIVAAACRQGVQLLVTHHPLIFKPLPTIDIKSTMGRIIEMAVQHKLGIFAAHTNLDSVAGGLNDVIAEKIGLRDMEVLGRPVTLNLCKLVVFVPVGHEEKILEVLATHKAGVIGNYSGCAFMASGKGTFRPEAGATPFIGQPGEVTRVDETRIETIVKRPQVNRIVEKLTEAHPYETMAYDVYPLRAIDTRQGLGRVGSLPRAQTLEALSRDLKKRFDLPLVKFVGDSQQKVERVAICSGSGSSMIPDFLKSDAQAYISGDLKHHDARNILEEGRAMIDISHYHSEHLIVEVLAAKLREEMEMNGFDASVSACRLEADPFNYI